MYNYLINWTYTINYLLPLKKRKAARIQFIKVLISAMKARYESLLSIRTTTLYDLSFTGQVIYLEKRLNDQWDAVNKGIYIDHPQIVLRDFIYNKVENKPKRYLYNKWNSAVAYVNGEFAKYGDKVYVALAANTNITPGTNAAYWQVAHDPFYLINNVEYLSQNNFIVYVPNTVTFDTSEMKAVINRYKLVGKKYSILTY
jgi:hypothetical protein